METISVEKNVWERVTYQKRQIFCDCDMEILENPRVSPLRNELYTFSFCMRKLIEPYKKKMDPLLSALPFPAAVSSAFPSRP